MQINKFTNNIDDPLHTNGFAAAARNSGGIGASTPQSFNQRLHIERNRQNVNRYHDSMIANGRHHEGAYRRLDSALSNRTSVSTEQDSNAGDPTSYRRPAGRLISDVVKPVVRPHFTEPPTRGYNPYR